MLTKIGGWILPAILVFFVVKNPSGAASVVKTVFTGLTDFATHLAA
jgi:hypothetical protein